MWHGGRKEGQSMQDCHPGRKRRQSRVGGGMGIVWKRLIPIVTHDFCFKKKTNLRLIMIHLYPALAAS
jgi:hypothetical protein